MLKFLVLNLLFFNTTFQDLDKEISALKDSLLFYKNSNPEKALSYGFEALAIGDYYSPTGELVSVNTLIGELLALQNLDAEALQFYNESLRLFEAIPRHKRIEKRIELPPWVLVNIGNIYYGNRKFDKAKEKYLLAKENFEKVTNEKMRLYGMSTINDNLALIALSKDDYDTAESFLRNSYAIRKEIGKAEDLIYSNLLLMQLFTRKGDFFICNDLFLTIENIYQKEKDRLDQLTLEKSYLQRNYAFAYQIMGKLFGLENKHKATLDYFLKARDLLIYFPAELPKLNASIAEIYLKMNRPDLALERAQANLGLIKGNYYRTEKQRNFKVLEKIYRQKKDNNNLIKIKDSLLSLASFGQALAIGDKFNELENNILLSKKRSELNENRIRYNTYLFILIIGATILLFSLISLRLNFNLQKGKAEQAITEKLIIENDLKHKKIELINKSNFIAQRNQNLNYLLDSIDQTKANEDLTLHFKEKINMLLKSQSVNDRFEKQFEEVYPGFFRNLVTTSDKLTQLDLRLCAYLKMNQTTQEIAQLTGASIRTIESQKYRLKKKLNIEKRDNLIHFIQRI